MCLTATTSGKVVQMLVYATTEWELGREAQAASLVLSLKTRPECPEGYLRKLMSDSNPNCGIATETEKKIVL